MTNAHGTNERAQALLVKHIPDHAVGLALVQASLCPARYDPAGILAAVLQQAESFAYLGSDLAVLVVEEETEDAAH